PWSPLRHLPCQQPGAFLVGRLGPPALELLRERSPRILSPRPDRLAGSVDPSLQGLGKRVVCLLDARGSDPSPRGPEQPNGTPNGQEDGARRETADDDRGLANLGSRIESSAHAILQPLGCGFRGGW